MTSNTPGKPAVERRVGSAATFSQAMSAGLSRRPGSDRLTTRRTDDPAIALVDAWSAVLDVLTFYSERLSNEGYLRTARDPRSLVELAATVGYVPGRGRASATVLAFTLEDASGSPDPAPIPRGTKVATLAGPNELPQTYETTEELVGRPQWNAMRARRRLPQTLGVGATSAYVEGIRADLSVGDAVLLVGPEREESSGSGAWAFRLVSGVTPIAGQATTRISWTDPLGSPPPGQDRTGVETLPDPRDARLLVLRKKASVFGAAAPDHRLIDSSVTKARSTPRTPAASPAQHEPTFHVDPFVTVFLDIPAADWPDWSVVAPDQAENTVDLDAVYPAVSVGGWVVLARAGACEAYRVAAVSEQSRTDYALNGKVSQLVLEGPAVSTAFDTYVRQTSVWVGSQLLDLAGRPDAGPVQGSRIELEAAVPTPEAGRALAVRGPRPSIRVAEGVRTLAVRRTGAKALRLHPGDVLEVVGPVVVNPDRTTTWVTSSGALTAPPDAVEPVGPPADAPVHSEVVSVAGPAATQPTVDALELAQPMTGCYDRSAVQVLGNVAAATHGETATLVLGSGDAATAYQSFVLPQRPLTYVAARSGGSIVSTLEVRVGGRRWIEVPQLFGTRATDEVFTTLVDDAGTVTIRFGDGRTGARLPTGSNNVTATYRVGTGLAGRADADRLTMPMTRPLGLRAVTNPLASGLAADLEPPDRVRANAPLNALTLGRVVSLTDVRDFSLAVPGIDLAEATWLWDGRRRFVHLTVVGDGGQQVDVQALVDLEAALRTAGTARLPLVVAAAEPVTTRVSASVVVDPAYDASTVLAAVSTSVTAALAPVARALGLALTVGDVILAAQGVSGVIAVNVTLPTADVPALRARMVAGVAQPAQLVSLAPGGLALTEAAS